MSTLFEKLSSNLLDLGARNKLLNFKDSKNKSLEIINPLPNDIFKMLNDDKTLRFIRSELEGVEPEEEEENEDETSLSLIQELDNNEIIGYKRKEKYDQVLKSIKRFNDSVMIEKGIGVLYMAFGLIKWTQANFSRYELKSPILLVPIDLFYNRYDQSYSLKRVEDEVIVNPALKSKFELEFNVSLPDFEEEDDFDTYFSKIIELADENNWEVSDNVYVGIYSFAKLTMYKDLKNNEEAMEARPIVNAIFNGKQDEGFDNGTTTDYDEYFDKGEELKLFNVVDADSSQIRAIQEAKNGRSFVIQGPPGTGKSQTITNIIAELMHDGKNVLFVSEKISALNVVYNNLKKVGLESFCVQLHSDKTKKKEFVEELYNILKNPPKGGKNRESTINELLKYKKELDKYSESIFKVMPVINLRPYDIISRANGFKQINLNYRIKDIQNKGLDYLGHVIDLLDKYSSYKGGLADNYWKSPWYGFFGNKYLYSEEHLLKQLFKQSFNCLKSLINTYESLSSIVDIDIKSISDIRNHKEELLSLFNLNVLDINLFEEKKAKKISDLLNQYVVLRAKFKNEFKKLTSVLDEGIFQLKIFELYKKFNGEYNTIFRIFNSKYKADASLINSYNKRSSKLGFNELKIYIGMAYKLKLQRKELNDIQASLKQLTDFDYTGRDDLQEISDSVKSFVDNQVSPIHIKGNLNELSFNNVKRLSSELVNSLSNLDPINELQVYFDKDVFNITETNFNDAYNKLSRCVSEFDDLKEWVRFYDLFLELGRQDLLSFIEECLHSGVTVEKLSEAFSYIYYTEWMMHVYYLEPTLSNFRRNNQDLYVKRFIELDKKSFYASEAAIREKHNDNIRVLNDTVYYFPKNPITKQVAVISHEANKKRAVKPIRVVLKEARDVVKILKPCFLMSPLSVATYLEYNPNTFDVVIFDEASQIFPWDAIGAISRSKQVIVVGDSKQMPPTNFFMAGTSDYGDEDYEEYEDENASDYESILDLCSAVLPHTLLNWHYRSRSEALIAFSNHFYYGDRLVTFPSQYGNSDDFGIDFHYVKDATFNNRSNLKEAKKVVDLIFEHFTKYPERSLGVVCFSINQQALLQDVLDERRRNDKQFERYFEEKSVKEPFFIKNLETVQGDERDTIIFSVGYGKDSAGNLKHNFGPLNRLGGERRLNVAITRAKYNVKVVSSIHAYDIDLSRTKAEGARLLKEYLDIAENGLEKLNREIKVNSNAEAESPFEEEVANFIRSEGYKVDLQVGCSGFRIDLCVKHPKYDDYVLAIECDGATYHSSKNTRDRDRLRQEVLERLGWKFYRIWSTDWFVNTRSEKEHLSNVIKIAISEFDAKVKEAEERKQKALEERFAEAEKQEKKEREQEELPFTYTLTDSQKNLIETVNEHLALKDIRFVKADRAKLYSYRVYDDVQNGLVHYWFWFTKVGDDLIFKYRNTPSDDFTVKSTKVTRAAQVTSIIDGLINMRYHKKQEVKPSVQTSLFEDEPKQKEENLLIYYSIIKTMKGKISYFSPKEKEVVLKIVEFVNNVICDDAIANKYFKNKEEFNRFKNSRRITYNFFGTHFNLGSVTIPQAKTFYTYYKASCLITKIQEYEKMLNISIIDDYHLLITSLAELISNQDYVFSRAKGVNSNLSLVDDSVLMNELNKFKIFE